MANQRGESTSIGHFWNRCIDAVNNLFETYSFWTHAKDVEFDDGEVAQNKVGAINGITSDLTCEDESIAVSAKAVNDSLGGFSFQTVDGKKQVSTDGGETWSNFSGGAELLWTNPSPTSAFPAQTLSIDLSGYESVIIVCNPQTESTDRTNNLVSKGTSCYLSATLTGSPWGFYRNVTVSETQITFENGHGNNGTSGTYCYPLEIYGTWVSLE